MIFADDVPIAIPEWNWLESSTEEHETEFSLAMSVILGGITALRCQAITTRCIGTGCTMKLCGCAYGDGKENECVCELHCHVG